MAEKKLTVTDKGVGRYRTRMLKAGDPVTLDGPKARLYQALGWAKERKQAKRPQLDHDQDGKEGGSITAPNLTALRREYFEKVGKRPFNGWDAAELRKRMNAA